MGDTLKTSSPSLTKLSDANYEVAPGERDVRGWTVVLGGDERVGRVDDLIIEPAAGKVRYLDVDLDRKAAGIERARHVMIPVETHTWTTDAKRSCSRE